MKKRIQYADDNVRSIKQLLRIRIPPLIIGLFLGILLSFITSRFGEVLSKNIAVAFFIPLVVYLADAVGTQTQNIYTRDLKSGRAKFKKYLVKETILGLILGVIFSLFSTIIIFLWFDSLKLAAAVGLSMFVSIFSAPLIALFVTALVQREREDPAVGSGPIATIIQDTASVVIYGLISSAIIL